MGTDIHLEVETRRDGLWHFVPHIERDCWSCALTAERESKRVGKPVPVEFDKKCYWCRGTGKRKEQFFHDRNYSVFAILASVRNGIGFAGVDTGDGFIPIAEPRGLPPDLSFELRRHLKREEEGMEEDEKATADMNDDEFARDYISLGDHSQTWLLLSEVLACDWNQTTKRRGWVDPNEYDNFRKHGQPNSWSGSVSGSMIEHVSNAFMAHMIDSGDIVFTGPEPEEGSFAGRAYTTAMSRGPLGQMLAAMPKGTAGRQIAEPTHYVTLVEWTVTYRESAQHFLDIVEKDLVPLGPPTDTRLVFGFDS